jgi:hypothetical protein
MKKLAMFVGLLALAAPSLFITPAQAQATRTWISGVGDDVNPCSRTAPCKTFPGAISKTAAGGEIDTLDPGGFGAVTVTKAITLANEGIGEAGILVAGTNGITVNCSVDPTCLVVVRGLVIDGGPIGSNSLAGVRFIAGGAFTPSASSSTELDVTDTTITTNGQAGGGATIGGGIYIAPTGTPNVKATFTRVQLLNNTNGVRIDASSATGGTIRTTVEQVSINNSGFHGFAANVGAGATAITTMFDNSQSTNSGGDNLVSNGATSNLYLSNSVSMGALNQGVAVANSGVITSYKNNVIAGNHNDNLAVLTLVNPT